MRFCSNPDLCALQGWDAAFVEPLVKAATAARELLAARGAAPPQAHESRRSVPALRSRLALERSRGAAHT